MRHAPSRRAHALFKETPESLTDVGAHFWSENFPEVFERQHIDEHAVPAYLGQVLVRNLVGQRVWLPMVRAHRYLRSRQSLLDFSLTQLYRAAELHRG